MSQTKPHILLVDDELELLLLMKEKIEGFGFSVVCAESHKEALEKLRNEKFAVIILDIGLKAKSGLTIVDFIRDNSNSLNRLTPILINSGLIAAEVIDEYRDKVNDFFVKPVDYELLELKLQEWSTKRLKEPSRANKVSKNV